MQLFENISMALASVKSNKMRSALTMLGIIIGIAAVIAIETVGNSMTGSVTDSMAGMGASNISVSVVQKSANDTSGTAQGVTLRRFMDSKPSDADLITDADRSEENIIPGAFDPRVAEAVANAVAKAARETGVARL